MTRRVRTVGGPKLEVSEGLYDMIRDQIVRALELHGIEVQPREVLDAAINRCLDALERKHHA